MTLIPFTPPAITPNAGAVPALTTQATIQMAANALPVDDNTKKTKFEDLFKGELEMYAKSTKFNQVNAWIAGVLHRIHCQSHGNMSPTYRLFSPTPTITTEKSTATSSSSQCRLSNPTITSSSSSTDPKTMVDVGGDNSICSYENKSCGSYILNGKENEPAFMYNSFASSTSNDSGLHMPEDLKRHIAAFIGDELEPQEVLRLPSRDVFKPFVHELKWKMEVARKQFVTQVCKFVRDRVVLHLGKFNREEAVCSNRVELCFTVGVALKQQRCACVYFQLDNTTDLKKENISLLPPGSANFRGPGGGSSDTLLLLWRKKYSEVCEEIWLAIQEFIMNSGYDCTCEDGDLSITGKMQISEYETGNGEAKCFRIGLGGLLED